MNDRTRASDLEQSAAFSQDPACRLVALLGVFGPLLLTAVCVLWAQDCSHSAHSVPRFLCLASSICLLYLQVFVGGSLLLSPSDLRPLRILIGSHLYKKHSESGFLAQWKTEALGVLMCLEGVFLSVAVLHTHLL